MNRTLFRQLLEDAQIIDRKRGIKWLVVDAAIILFVGAIIALALYGFCS